MATLVRSGTTGGTGGGNADYQLYAEQTAGSGNERTIKLTLKLRINGNVSYPSWYGYAVNWYAIINGHTSSAMKIKGTESWSTSTSWRSFTYTYKTNVGTTSSKAITVGCTLDSLTSTLWDQTTTGSFTVDATNTAPYFASGAKVALKTTSSGGTTIIDDMIIAENTSSIYISWPSASDRENHTRTYEIWRRVNGTYTKIAETTSTNYTHAIGTGNNGTEYRYRVRARDSVGLTSGYIYSNIFTKNDMIGHSLDVGFSIGYDSSTLSLSYSGAKNNNGNTTFTLKWLVDGLTVHNSTVASNTLTIWKSGSYPSTPYIRYSDLLAKVDSDNYQGALYITLQTSNAYGTMKESKSSTSVDLRTNPAPATGQQISTSTSESTNYKRITSGAYYYLPDGSAHCRVKWTRGSDRLGGTFTQELYVAYGTGSYSHLATLDSSATFYNHKVPRVSARTTIKYMIRTKTAYGYTSDAVTPAKNLDYYSAPTMYVRNNTRQSTSASIGVTFVVATSIPSVTMKGTWSRTGSSTNTTLSASKTQTLSVTGLADTGTYTLTVSFNDSTGLTASNISFPINIGQNLSVFFVNRYGAGVGGVKADANYSLKVKGKALFEDGADIVQPLPSGANLDNYTTNGFYESGTDGNSHTVVNRPTITLGFSLKVTNVWRGGSNGGRVIQELMERRTGVIYTRYREESLTWSGWTASYNENHKPTPAEIGAAASSHTHTAASVGALPITGGQLNDGGVLVATMNKYGSTIYNNLNIRNIAVGDIALEMTRGDTGTAWKMLSSGGQLKIQTDWNNEKGPYFDVMTFANTSGNVNINKGNIQVQGRTVVASATNSNGTYIRYYDGTQICTKRVTTNVTYRTWGNIFYTHDIALGSWAAAFTETPVVTTKSKQANMHTWEGIVTGATSSTIGTTYLFRASTTNNTQVIIDIIGIGRWR